MKRARFAQLPSISSGSICLNVPGALLNLLRSRSIYSARG